MLTADESNEIVLAHLDLAEKAAGWFRRFPNYDFEDCNQAAVVGMLSAARCDVPEYIGLREYLLDAAFSSIRKMRREDRKFRGRNYWTRDWGDNRPGRPLVEVLRSKKKTSPIDILGDNEWWELLTGHLSSQEREYVRLRIQESKDLRASADEMGLSPYDARLLEKSVMTSCGKVIRKRLKANEHDLPFAIDVPNFMERPAEMKNGRAVVDVATGRVYPTLSALAREIGCKVADINHAIKRKGGKFERWQFRHATDEERDSIRLEESKKSVTVRKDYRSRGVVEVVSGRFFHSILKAAKETSVPQPTLYKSLSSGSGRINGYCFRFATERENEVNRIVSSPELLR